MVCTVVGAVDLARLGRSDDRVSSGACVDWLAVFGWLDDWSIGCLVGRACRQVGVPVCWLGVVGLSNGGGVG